jgi:hypothetical protein
MIYTLLIINCASKFASNEKTAINYNDDTRFMAITSV